MKERVLNTKSKTAAHVVLGLDKEGKCRAALVHPSDLETATRAATAQGFKIGRADSPQVLKLAMQLPDAKVFATGKGLVPLVRKDIYEWLRQLPEASTTWLHPKLKSTAIMQLPALSTGLRCPADGVGELHWV
jgi:hypothetical protein